MNKTLPSINEAFLDFFKRISKVSIYMGKVWLKLETEKIFDTYLVSKFDLVLDHPVGVYFASKIL